MALKTFRRLIAAAGVILLCLPAVSAMPAAAASPSAPAPRAAGAIPVLADGMTLGDPAAPVTLQVYLSFGCPHCRDWYNHVFPVLKKKYIDTGKVRLVVVEFSAGHQALARAGAIAARCAGPDRYFAVAEALFAASPRAKGAPGEMDENGQPLADTDSWTRAALKTAGVSDRRIKACDAAAQGAAMDARMDRAMAEFPGYRGGTPAFVANGEPVEAGTLDWAEYAIAVTSKAAGHPLTTATAYDLFCVGAIRYPGALRAEPWETRWSFQGERWRLASAPASDHGAAVVRSDLGVTVSDGQHDFVIDPDGVPRLTDAISGEAFNGRCGVAPLTPFPK